MTEAKQEAKKNSGYFPKVPDTNIVPVGERRANEFSFDILNKPDTYLQGIFINNDVPNAMGINSQTFLSKSENNCEHEKKSLSADTLQVLIQNPLVNKQTSEVLKFERKKIRLLVKRGVVNGRCLGF